MDILKNNQWIRCLSLGLPFVLMCASAHGWISENISTIDPDEPNGSGRVILTGTQMADHKHAIDVLVRFFQDTYTLTEPDGILSFMFPEGEVYKSEDSSEEPIRVLVSLPTIKSWAESVVEIHGTRPLTEKDIEQHRIAFAGSLKKKLNLTSGCSTGLTHHTRAGEGEE